MINVQEYILEYYPDEADDIIIFTDDLDEAFIGIGYSFHKPYACYSKNKIIDICVNRDGMTYEEAEEYYEFNIAGLYTTGDTPILIEEI